MSHTSRIQADDIQRACESTLTQITETGDPDRQADLARRCLDLLRTDAPGVDYGTLRFEAMHAAGDLLPGACPLLVDEVLNALDDPQLRVRHVAASWIGVIGSHAGEAQPRVVDRLADLLPGSGCGEVSGCSWAGIRPLLLDALREIDTPAAQAAIREWQRTG